MMSPPATPGASQDQLSARQEDQSRRNLIRGQDLAAMEYSFIDPAQLHSHHEKGTRLRADRAYPDDLSWTPCIDKRLLHLWEAGSLTERWKRQRHKRKLRKIYELNRKAAEYAAELCKENWLSLCDGLQGALSALSARKTWQLFRHLIDPMTSKSETNRNTTRTINNYGGDAVKLMEDLRDSTSRPRRSQIIHMIWRVASRQRGMKEADTLKLVQAFIISRVTYAIPQLVNWEDVVYTDASKDQGTYRPVAVVTTKKMLTSVSVEVKYVEEAEEVAIALALTLPGRTRVVTDSQQAYRSFHAAGAQKQEIPKEPIDVVWVPAHSVVEGNELAHRQARALTYRATAVEEVQDQPMMTYKEIVTFYRKERQ
ncbi:hypothetical protein HPB47_028060 [Ixodes persulcatus]|uniref:Uncharacterized protein n=1 Tax=Ixodes persulcatus TaxID=34615 RepID=A0AC60PWK8_IXOPE|nr:hypothetical protein HPB47_028060 [Ixodes persulcatus]